MINVAGTLTHFHNPKAKANLVYSDKQKAVFDIKDVKQAVSDISSLPNYQKTPLRSLNDLAKDLGIKKIWYKDESLRFDLKSFKALGGSYAVARQLQQLILNEKNVKPGLEDLINGKYKDVISKVVVSCATDGNHGRSVAWGCRLFGCECIIYIHRDVSIGRQKIMENLGATVVRITGNYDESVRLADSDAKKHKRIIVSDTTYKGYTEIPKDVGLGYSVMLAEIMQQLNNETPTHVFIQAGVGGLAAVVCGFFWQVFNEKRPRFITVEPVLANCLQASAKANKLTTISGDLDTIMAGLACGEVSLIAWDVLENGVNDFLTLSESAVGATMKLLANGYKNDPKIEAGESAVPGLAALILEVQNNFSEDKLGLNKNSKVLIIGTEGATDPELYQKLIA